MTSRSLFAAMLWIFLTAEVALPCTTTALYDPKTMVAAADLILRVKAVEYSSLPLTLSPRMAVEFIPASNVDFSVEEVVKGKYEKPHIILPGYLTEQDEWNRQNQHPPYASLDLRQTPAVSRMATTQRRLVPLSAQEMGGVLWTHCRPLD